MKLLLSPAKTLDFETPLGSMRSTEIRFPEQSQTLIESLRSLSAQEIAKMMKLSDKLAALNVARYESWQFPYPEDHYRHAIFAFKGDVYTGLDAQTMNNESLAFAQQNLRILSGLYGLLRPLDTILPYRLEMGTKLQNPVGKDLYQFWGEQITDLLNQELETESDGSPVINLASQEYFKAIKVKSLAVPVISPEFKDEKNGQYKIISFYAKKARGLMARYIIDNQLTSPEQILDFNSEGYRYSPDDSTPAKPVFVRSEADRS